MSHYPTAGSSSMAAVDRRTTSRRSPWRRDAIPTGSAASSMSGRAIRHTASGRALGRRLDRPDRRTTGCHACDRAQNWPCFPVGTRLPDHWSPAPLGAERAHDARERFPGLLGGLGASQMPGYCRHLSSSGGASGRVAAPGTKAATGSATRTWPNWSKPAVDGRPRGRRSAASAPPA